MGAEGANTDQQQGPVSSMDVALEIGYQQLSTNSMDDDGRPRRTGTLWTSSAHIITAVIGSGVLSLAWSIAQLGWIAGPSVMIIFAVVVCYTSSLLADCYRTGDPITGKRNYTYMEVVQANLEIIFSQIPDFDQIWWLSIVAAVMSFTYSSIGLALGITEVIRNGHFKGSVTGVSVGSVSKFQKIWHTLQAFGDIAFAYSYSNILIEIQDSIKSPPPSEAQVMKKANFISVAITTVFYSLCGSMGYAAFGDSAPGNLLTGFGFYNPYWLLNIANAAIVVHLVGAYQVFSQPLFAFVEKSAREKWPESRFINKDVVVSISKTRKYKVNLFRMVWRTAYVIFTTVLSMMLPFFNDIVGLMGALGFWPLTVYFPVEIYIVQQKMERWSTKWVCLQLLSLGCLIISVAAAIGSVASIVDDLKVFKPFSNNY